MGIKDHDKFIFVFTAKSTDFKKMTYQQKELNISETLIPIE